MSYNLQDQFKLLKKRQMTVLKNHLDSFLHVIKDCYIYFKKRLRLKALHKHLVKRVFSDLFPKLNVFRKICLTKRLNET